MMLRPVFSVGLAVILLFSAASAQKAEVTISLDEPFFDSLLDSVFQNFEPPEFSMAETDPTTRGGEAIAETGPSNLPALPFWGHTFFAPTAPKKETPYCAESIKILREMNGVRTAVRFRDGKIYVPLAFSGNYAPPLIGCVEFSGWAESNIDLEFDQNAQKLFGRVRVSNVNLSGTGGIGGTLVAKLVQNSIDKKLNPIEIMSLDKISFGFPVQKSGSLKMKALRIRPEVTNAILNIRVEYIFLKG